MVSIFKAEKGAGALKKLQDGGGSSSGKVKVISKASAGKKKVSKGAPVAIASKLIKKTPGNVKKSVGKVKTGKTPGHMKTPTGTGSALNTPKPDNKNFKKMMAFLKQQKKK